MWRDSNWTRWICVWNKRSKWFNVHWFVDSWSFIGFAHPSFNPSIHPFVHSFISICFLIFFTVLILSYSKYVFSSIIWNIVKKDFESIDYFNIDTLSRILSIAQFSSKIFQVKFPRINAKNVRECSSGFFKKYLYTKSNVFQKEKWKTSKKY